MTKVTKTKKKSKNSLPLISNSSRTRFKKGTKIEGAKVVVTEPLKMTYKEPKPQDLAVPAPWRDTAMAISKTVLEHVYWLGNAIKNGDKDAGQREVDAIARFSTLYFNFAKNPDEQPLKFSTADNYPDNAKKYKGGKKPEYSEEAESEDN